MFPLVSSGDAVLLHLAPERFVIDLQIPGSPNLIEFAALQSPANRRCLDLIQVPRKVHFWYGNITIEQFAAKKNLQLFCIFPLFPIAESGIRDIGESILLSFVYCLT